MSAQARERLEKIQQESITDAIEWGCTYGNRSQVKTERIIADVEWLIEQAEQTESFKKLHKSYLDKYVDAVGERNALQEENNRLREALQFYANDKNYEPNVVDQWAPVVPVNKDYGEIARAVLEENE